MGGDVLLGDADTPPPECPPWTSPPGFGGPVDSRVDLETAEAWRRFRADREQERMLEAWDPQAVQRRYRIEQDDILNGCLSLGQVVDVGRGLFLRNFTLAEGYGNDLASLPGTLAGNRPRPNVRRFQRGRFGGPDASGCHNCHWKGGFVGAGDRADNTFAFGDGEDLETHDARNPPALWGAGWTELIGREMSEELQQQRDVAGRRALDTNASVTTALNAKGVSFGRLVARPDGLGGVTFDTRQVEGVDADLVVKPFGWKGVFVDLRAFVVSSTQLHLNMQAEEAVAAFLNDPEAGNHLGEGQGDDPDADGVRRELTEGQLTALVLFLATLDTPSIDVGTQGGFTDPNDLIPAISEPVYGPEYIERWLRGAELFEDFGCSWCHRPLLEVRSSVYRTTASLSGSTVEVDLAASAAAPRPQRTDEGTWLVPVFSDFKRHDMGDWLAGRHEEKGVGPRLYMTRRLWGVAQTSPWLHDASANSFDEAVAMHAGPGSEAEGIAQLYLDAPEAQRSAIRVFLLSLRRAPAIRVR